MSNASIRMKQSATGPSTPPSGYSTLWAKTDDEFYVTSDTGVVTSLTGPQGPTGPTGPSGAGKYFGSFYSRVDQSVAAINTPTLVATDSYTLANGISALGGRVYIDNKGYYKAVINALASNLDGNAQDITFWLKYNGSDYPYSAHTMSISARKSAGVPTEQLVSFEFLGQAVNDNDTFEVYWQTTSTAVTLQSKTGSGIPNSASVWINVTQL